MSRYYCYSDVNVKTDRQNREQKLVLDNLALNLVTLLFIGQV